MQIFRDSDDYTGTNQIVFVTANMKLELTIADGTFYLSIFR